MKKLLKNIYESIPFKKHLYKLVRKAKPSSFIYQHLHFKGWMQVRLNQSFFKIYHYGCQVENDLFWSGINGNWEKQSLELWIRLCKQSNVILDIGANTGVYSLVAKTINREAKVYAFEPSKEVAPKLRRNIQANGYNIEALEVALSNHNGVAIFHDKTGHNYTGSLNAGNDTNTIAYEVKTQTLDSFVEENHLGIDLIKMDVEKHEPEVIEGFKKYILIQQPTILIEILEDEIAQKIQSLIEDIPYLYFNLNEKGTIRRAPQLSKSDDFNYLICREDVAKSIGLI